MAGVSETFVRLRESLGERYVIEKELGRGGMATVFLARDVKHDRDVAIKVLHPELSVSIGAERFEREIKLAAKLQHPHILGLYDSGSADGLLYYVMPFVRGESLRDRLTREGMLSVDDAVRITVEVAGALQHAHDAGIVHRDIKPENILLAGDHALVADFGIARAANEAGQQKLTQTGMAVGTPVYMAPEQSSGDLVGPTADIYSLGCVLYEMLAGEPPFTGPNSMAVMSKHLMEVVPSVRVVRNAVPEEVEAAIFFALAKTPVDRPKTAQLFAEALGGSTRDSAALRALRKSQAMRGSMAMRGSVAVPRQTVAGAIYTTDQFGELVELPWWRRPIAIAGAAVAVVAAVGAWFVMQQPSSVVSTDPAARRIAVLYFNDLSRDSSLSAMADGLTEGLIRALGASGGINVIQRSGVEPYRRSDLAVDSIARALGVGFLVRGDIEPERDRLRVGVRLVDASGVEVERSGFTVPGDSALVVQDSLVSVAGELIRRRLGAEIRLKEQRAATSVAAAWLATQRGLQAQRALVGVSDSVALVTGYRRADSIYAEAARLDPRWAEPVMQRAALAYQVSRSVGTAAEAIRPWIDSGMVHANAALTLDRKNADAAEVRGNLQYWGWLTGVVSEPARREALLAAAKADFDSATVWNPAQAGAWASLSHLYTQLPTVPTTEALIAAQKALEADEFLSNANVVRMRLFLAAYDLGQFDRAGQACRELLLRFPNDPRSYRCQLYMLTVPNAMSDARTLASEIAKGWRFVDSTVAKSPPRTRVRDSLTVRMLMAGALARASEVEPGLADSARKVARSSLGDASIDATRELAYFGAFVATVLGDKPDAYARLRDYLAANPHRADGLKVDEGWFFRALAQDAEFKRLVGRQ